MQQTSATKARLYEWKQTNSMPKWTRWLLSADVVKIQNCYHLEIKTMQGVMWLMFFKDNYRFRTKSCGCNFVIPV